MDYIEFIKNKFSIKISKKIDIKRDELNPNLFEYQKDLVYLALRKGKFAIFAMTGTGKTAMQGEWAYMVHKYENKPVLILAPLAVAEQTVDEIKKILGYDVQLCKSQNDVINGINITNYEKLDKFDPSAFAGIVLDESSILKSFTSKTKEQIIEKFKKTPYKLACTATPAPNDYMELGNHSEFLDVMTRTEMLSMFFVHDGGDTSKWRLKRHAEDKYWQWVSTWAAVFTKPSDLGYSDNEDRKFQLPKKYIYEHIVQSKAKNALFATYAQTLQERREARKNSLYDRCITAAKLVNQSEDIWIVWCDLNAESELLHKLIPDSVEIKGSDKDSYKAEMMSKFARGEIRVLITKPSIAGFGMNWQICHNTCFVGLSDSFEQYFQAVRRCYRFGQTKDVNIHVLISEAEGAVKTNIERKERDYLNMINSMVQHTKNATMSMINDLQIEDSSYNPQIEMKIPNFLKEAS